MAEEFFEKYGELKLLDISQVFELLIIRAKYFSKPKFPKEEEIQKFVIENYPDRELLYYSFGNTSIRIYLLGEGDDSTWNYLEEPIVVVINDVEYTIIAEDVLEFGRYLAKNPLGEEVVLREEEVWNEE